jgi:large subunit ribosomal protein L22
MDVRVYVKSLPISAQKLRLVCDQVRGADATQALTMLRFMPQKGARFVSKAVASGIANAENNFDLDPANLYVKTIFADGAMMQKRYKAGARGRYKPRLRRSAHLTVILSDRQGE